MARTKTYTRIASSCLISGLILFSFTSFAASPFNLGKITQAEGEITFLNFIPPHKLETVKKDQNLQSEGSYLTQDDAFMTVQLFDGSWLRLSPNSKISMEYEPTAKVMTVHLITGSLKTLFSNKINEGAVDKIIIKSTDGTFESVDGKFSVVRNPVTDMSSVYVEKGTVVVMQNDPIEMKQAVLVHTKEMAFVKYREAVIETPRHMTDEEMKFLHPSKYLKKASKI